MKDKKLSLVGITLTLIILIVIVVLSNTNKNNSSVIGNGINQVFMPIQNGFIYLKNKVTGKESQISDIKVLKEENNKLKQENENLKKTTRELEVLKSENNTLKDYLHLKNKYADYQTVPGYIIEKSFSNYDKLLVINVGEKDGIRVNMPVISESGLVGHVIEVNKNSSKVETIIDTASTVSASISTSNDSILLKGSLNNQNELKATSIQVEATILQGDDIVTSGLGGIYPKGILVGRIKEIINTKNQIDRYAKVETATNFNKLENVLVIVNQRKDEDEKN